MKILTLHNSEKEFRKYQDLIEYNQKKRYHINSWYMSMMLLAVHNNKNLLKDYSSWILLTEADIDDVIQNLDVLKIDCPSFKPYYNFYLFKDQENFNLYQLQRPIAFPDHCGNFTRVKRYLTYVN